MKNIAVSVRDRLLNVARREGKPFQRVLTLYMQEGLLHRLVSTDLGETIVLKGGLLLYHLRGFSARPTKDIDLLGREAYRGADTLRQMLEDACDAEIDDGLAFDSDSISVEPIRSQTDHGGIRGHVNAYLGTALTRLQIDMGFGDVIVGGPVSVSYRSLLGDRRFSVRVYPVQTVVAEKLEAVVSLGIINSRTKDLYDLFRLLVTLGTADETAVESAVRTFGRRSTELPRAPQALSDSRWESEAFARDWRRFLSRIGETGPSVDELRTVLLPRLRQIYEQARRRLQESSD